MRIGITLNEVLRDFLGQMAYVYNNYEKPFQIEDNPVTDIDKLHKVFGFESKDVMNQWLYSDHSFEVFSAGDQTYANVMTEFNHFLMDIIDEEEHEVVIISREAGRSIPATLFFLSKLGCMANNIKFVTKYEEKWDDIDVLITANPRALKCKPEGKISIKVESTYNTDVEADYTITKLSDFIKSPELQDKVLNN